jgi:protein SCO1/2
MRATAAKAVRNRAIALLAVVLGTQATGAADGRLDAAAALRASQAAIGRQLRERELVDSAGQPLQLAAFKGRPLVLSLVYTNCLAVCSGASLHLRDVVRIARDALGADSFAVLTIGFDAPHDSPARMHAFAVERGIDDPQWRFASADAATIRGLTDEVGFSWTASPGGFDHVTQVTVLDADGRVVQQVYGADFSPPDLIEPLKDLVLRGGAGRPAVLGLADRLRLLCSAYDPAARRYRFDYSMFIGALPAVLVLAMVAVAILVASRNAR